MADEARGFYARAVPPRGHPHRCRAAAILERFVREICGATADWIMRDYIAEAVATIREQVGAEEVILGLSRRRRFERRRGADPPRHRRPADLRLRRPRPAAPGRGRGGDGDVRRQLHAKVVHVDASAEFLGQLQGVTDPEQKRKIIGREFVEVFQREAEQAGKAQVAGAGHDLPRRDRERRRQDQEGDDDQEPPQRRRPARDAGPEAARAAARAVQGRGARARRRARPAARTWSTATRSPGRAWACASSAR